MTKNNITLEITDLIDSDEQLVKIVKSMDSKINNIPENIHTKHKIIMNKSKMIKIKNIVKVLMMLLCLSVFLLL